MATWVSDVEEALIQIGGKGNISHIAEKVKEIRKFSDNETTMLKLKFSTQSNENYGVD